jgi:PhoPQ-activated pathogenicity-related protein
MRTTCLRFRKLIHDSAFSWSLVFAVFLLASGSATAVEATPLDDYVYADDPEYTYQVVDTDFELTHVRYTLSLTSGSWRDESEVDRPLWKHWLTLYVPHRLVRDTALLVVSGGDSDSGPNAGSLDDSIGLVAITTGAVIADLGQVPDQPLTFADETEPRKEDALIAYSWKKFLEDPADKTWPAQFPMTRAVVRAMDAIQDHIGRVRPGDPINDFIIAGASKRGWVTWLAAAMENGPLGSDRVSAIIPMVIDVLNSEAAFEHHFKVYGFWAPAVHDYVDAGVMNYLGSDEIKSLFGLVDPHAYRERLTMPKIILNSCGDQFFLPDTWKFSHDELPGLTWLRYIPNTDHSLAQIEDPLTEILPLYFEIVTNGPESLPQHSWDILPDGSIRMESKESGASAKLWQATNPSTRDFRLEEIGAAFTSTDLTDLGGGVFVGQVPPPPSGWTAYFVEITFSDGTIATSGVSVATRSQPANLSIRKVNDDIELSFDGKPGNYYEIHRGQQLDEMEFIEGIIPKGGREIWIEPNPENPRQFYQLDVIEP